MIRQAAARIKSGYFLANRFIGDYFSTLSYLAFINYKLAKDGYLQDQIPLNDVLEQGKAALTQFYDSVNESDHAFIWNAK